MRGQWEQKRETKADKSKRVPGARAAGNGQSKMGLGSICWAQKQQAATFNHCPSASGARWLGAELRTTVATAAAPSTDAAAAAAALLHGASCQPLRLVHRMAPAVSTSIMLYSFVSAPAWTWRCKKMQASTVPSAYTSRPTTLCLNSSTTAEGRGRGCVGKEGGGGEEGWGDGG